MIQYRRNIVPGGTYFFTLTLRDRRSELLVTHAELLRESLRKVQATHPFTLDAEVVLPDHAHLIVTLPDGDSGYSQRLRAIKAVFTRSVVAAGASLRKNGSGEYDLWQRRFWEHTIRDAADLERHVDYIHFNPVKHGLVTAVKDWPHSSFHRFVREGLLPLDWAGKSVQVVVGSFGE